METQLHTYQAHPKYRVLPIVSGILIPFSILLSIPSLTDPWYVRTDANNVTLETRPKPFLLNLGLGLSMAFGILANICLIVRLSERKVLRMTWLCILFLTLHDLLNISAVSIYGVQHRSNDGRLTYGSSFWLTICSTIFSTTTNITLIVDYARTKNFVNSGSGLTDKQRSLVIINIILLCYIGLGSLVQIFTLRISFVDAIYFCVVSIESIGFGDIRPTSSGSRIFNGLFISGGILNLALAVGLIREVLLEGVALGFQARVTAIRTRQREHRIRTRWRTAVKSRLRANNLPMWVVDSGGENNGQDWQHHQHHDWWRWARQGWNFLKKQLSRKSADKCFRKCKHLNLRALTEAQMEEAALEAGAPLADLLPPGLHLPSLAATDDDIDGEDEEDPISDRGGIPFSHSMTMQDEASLEDTIAAEEKIAFATRLTLAFLVCIVFWMVGSAIFMMTEEWDFGTAAYLCFIAFTTVGYGDYSPISPTGRSVFVAWALLGVATMTIIISILVEAYSRQFKTVIRTDIFPDTNHGDNRRRQILNLESAGTVNTGTNDSVSPRSLSATISSSGRQSFTLATSPMHMTGHRDWEPSMASNLEHGSQKKSLESLQAILGHVQCLRSLIVPESCLEVAADSIGSTSNATDLGAPQITRGLRRGVHKDIKIEIEKLEEIISAALCSLEVLDGEKQGRGSYPVAAHNTVLHLSSSHA